MLSFALSTALSVTNLPAFQPCQLDNHFEQLKDSKCIYAILPLNYTEENTQSIDVFVRKFPTKLEATGSLWLLAGGPGESGAAFYQDIDSLRVAFPTLDIYVQDHRGTGASSKLCKEENIKSEQGINLADNEWGPCYGQIYRAPDYVKSFSISNAAQDLTKLINHYKKGDTYIYGVSYGTQLALRVLSQNKVELNGVVLDSLVPHQLNKDYDLSNRSVVVNNIGIEALKRISDNPDDTIAKILAFKEKYPKVSDFDASLPRVSLSHLLGNFLDVPTLRDNTPELVNELSRGNAQPLKDAIAFAQRYVEGLNPGYANYGMSLMLVNTVTTAENNLRPAKTKEQIAKQEEKLAFTSPLPGLIAQSTLPTYKKDKWFAHVPSSDTPILVLHGDLDPKTHIDGAKAHLALFKNSKPKLVEYKGAQHAILMTKFAPQAREEMKQFFQQTSNK